MGLTATLNSHLTGLHSHLAASIGLTEAVASTLSQKALPVMVRTLCKADSLGSADNVWAMCQQFYQAQAHTNLTELTRTDSGWPEHRRHLAQTLLSTGRFIALTEHCAPATPDRAGQWLGCLALVTLAVAGQCAAENQLDAAGLQSWLRQQPLVPGEPLAEVAAPVAFATARPARAAANATTPTAPWWPLAVLAVVGIGASSYFWKQQTAAPASPLPKTETALLAARQPAPALGIGTAAPAAEAPKAAGSAAPGSAPPALSPALAEQPDMRAEPKQLAAVPAPKLAKNIAGAGPIVVHPGTKRVAPLASHGNSSSPNNGKGSRLRAGSGPLPSPPVAEEAGSTESQLYRRLANPESGSRKPIDLDHLSFAHGQAALDPEGTKQLSSIANVLKTFPHYRLIVFGNAESSEPNSIGLALDRANTVIAELVKQGVPSTALQAQGHLRSAADKAEDATAKRRPTLYISSLE